MLVPQAECPEESPKMMKPPFPSSAQPLMVSKSCERLWDMIPDGWNFLPGRKRTGASDPCQTRKGQPRIRRNWCKDLTTRPNMDFGHLLPRKNGKKRTPFAARSPRHAVYSHDVTGSTNDDGPDYDIDSALDIVQAWHQHGLYLTTNAKEQQSEIE
jgi:hypothetical protein